MKWLILSLLILAPAFTAYTSNSDDKFHICFFELDNTTTSKNFKEQKKRQNIKGATMHTFKPNSSNNTATAFEKMIKATKNKDGKGKRCDSLVISGHHTGNWKGKKGSLKLKELEALSCKPEYREWFSKIKALWLDGCNTVTDNALKATLPPSSDSESARVAHKDAVEAKNNITQNQITSLSQAYSLSLDKNTPFSSRYLRMFSNTQIYGFNGAAPLGRPDKKERDQIGYRSFIAEHLTNLGTAIQQEARSQNSSSKIQLGLNAIMSSSDHCNEESIGAWNKVGNNNFKTEAVENQSYDKARKIGCDLILAKQVLDNPNSETAQKALANKIKKILKDSNSINNTQKNLLDLANQILNDNSPENKKTAAVKLAKETILNSLDEITKEDALLEDHTLSLTHLLFSNIYDTWNTAKKYKQKDNEFFNRVRGKLKTKNFEQSFTTRITSDKASSLRRIDYIKFYVEVNDKKPGFINEAIENLVNKSLTNFSGLQSPRNRNLPPHAKRALALSVADQLLQYNLLTSDQIHTLKTSDKLFPKNTQDPFTLSVKMLFHTSNDTDLNNLYTKFTDDNLSPTETTPAMMALSRRFFSQLDNTKTDNNTFSKLTNLAKKTTQQPLKRALWNELHLYFNKKPKEKKIQLLDEYIKTLEDQGGGRLYGLLRVYKTEISK